MSYRQLLANLEALPEGERQLAGAVYLFSEGEKQVCGCVLGKGLPLLAEFIRQHPTYNEDSGFCEEVFGAGVIEPFLAPLGLTQVEARRAQSANDRFGQSEEEHGPDNKPETRRARHAFMVRWLRARVSEESEAPQAL